MKFCPVSLVQFPFPTRLPEGVAGGYVKHEREYDIDAGASGGGTGHGIGVPEVDEKDVTAPLADATFTLCAIDMDKAQDNCRR